MKYNKIVKENDYNKSSFLITCVCSIVLLLTLCYFGINSGVKGTYSLYSYEDQSKCAVLPSDYSSSNSSCPTGFTLNSQGKSCVKTYVIDTNNTENEIRNECSSYNGSKFNIVGNQASCSVDVICKSGATGGTGKCCPSGYTYGDKGYCVKSGYTLIQNPGGVDDSLGNEITSNLVCRTGSGTGTGTGEEACYFCSDTNSYHWTTSPGIMCSPKTQYTDGDSCTKATATVEYTVSYNANGGSVSPTSQKVKKDEFVTLPTPTKDGDEIFAGWYTAAIGGSFVGKGGASHKVTKTHTLYARWVSPDDKKCYQCSGDKSYVWTAIQPNTSCVEVAKNEAECDDSAQSSGTTSACYYCDDTKKYTWSATVPGASCTKAQYYTKSTCESADSGSQNPDLDPEPDSGGGSGGSDEKVTYKATFDPNDGNLVGDSTESCTANKGESCIIPTLPTANRNGYDHNGWGTTKSCTSGNTNSVSISGDTTFYACWQKTGGDGNPTENPPTGQTTTIAIIWFFGLLAIGYAFYYFKQVRGN